MSAPVGGFPLMLHGDDRYFRVRETDRLAHYSLGAHLCKNSGKQGVRFGVWAPNAKRVAMVGDFNDWQDVDHAMINHAVWAVITWP